VSGIKMELWVEQSKTESASLDIFDSPCDATAEPVNGHALTRRPWPVPCRCQKFFVCRLALQYRLGISRMSQIRVGRGTLCGNEGPFWNPCTRARSNLAAPLRKPFYAETYSCSRTNQSGYNVNKRKPADLRGEHGDRP